MTPLGAQHAKLIVSVEGREDSVVEVGDRLTIGRSTTNSLVLDDNRASRNHAEISNIGVGRYRLSDLGSANGTRLNGRIMTAPKDLQDGDEIQIGGIRLRFAVNAVALTDPAASGTPGTTLEIRNELLVVFVSDVRNYTAMSEALPGPEFSQLIKQWFLEASQIIEANKGTIDKFIGDAVMAYWVAAEKSDPSKEVEAALKTAQEFVQRAGYFSELFVARFSGRTFAVGVGISIGAATLCNVGPADHPSFTAVGDTVNVAFRIEPLTKTKGFPVIVTQDVAAWAPRDSRFQELGTTEVKGRRQPVTILGMTPPQKTADQNPPPSI